MSIINFLKSVSIPSLEKNASRKILEASIEELSWSLASINQILTSKLDVKKTTFYKERNRLFNTELKGDMLEQLQTNIPKVILVAQHLVTKVDDYFPKELIVINKNGGVTNKTLVYMRAVSHFDSLNKGVLLLLHGLLGAASPIDGVVPSEAESDAITLNIRYMPVILKAYSQKDLIASFDDMQDRILTDKSTSYDLLVSTYGSEKIDPLYKTSVSNFIPTVILSVRLKFAEYRAARYAHYQQLKTTLEMRLAYLKSGELDAGVEKQIAYEESRLKDVTARILMMEEAVR